MFLQGILRNSNQNLLCCDPIDESCNKSHCEIRHTTDNTNFSDDDNKTCSTLTSPKTNKHVRFDDKISKKEFKPRKPVLSVLKLSNRQEKKLEKLQRNDSLNLPTMNFTRINPINSLKFQQIDYSDSSENEPSDNDD